MAELTLAQLAVVPPIWLCTQEAVPGNPQAGGHLLQRIRGLSQLDCFGVRWNINPAPPAGIGEIVSTVGNTFDRPLLKFAQVSTDSTGNLLFNPILSTREAGGYFMFNQFPLVGLELECYPGVTVDLFWLVVFT